MAKKHANTRDALMIMAVPQALDQQSPVFHWLQSMLQTNHCCEGMTLWVQSPFGSILLHVLHLAFFSAGLLHSLGAG